MKTYAITNRRTSQQQHRLAYAGGAELVRVDYSSWAEDNGTVTDVTASVEYGDAAISGESLTANVKSMTITTASAGKSLIKLTATSGTDIDVQWLHIHAKDPAAAVSDDYGLVAA